MFMFYATCNKDNVNKIIDRFIDQCYYSKDHQNIATIELEVDKGTINPLAHIEFDKINFKFEDDGIKYYSITKGGDTIAIQFKEDKRRTKNLVFDIQHTVTEKQKYFFF